MVTALALSVFSTKVKPSFGPVLKYVENNRRTNKVRTHIHRLFPTTIPAVLLAIMNRNVISKRGVAFEMVSCCPT